MLKWESEKWKNVERRKWSRDKKGKQKQNPPTSLTSKDDRERENHDKRLR